MTKDLAIRKDRILGMIVESYVTSAEPIASRSISRRLRSTLSPATVRNVMADLEDEGLIMHPHTSAGRIPTEKGYRYYISRLMHAALMTEEEKKRVNKEFNARVNELDDMLEKTSHVLSSLTAQAGVVLFPVLQKSLFKHIELIRLGAKRFLVVLMTESGFTKDFAITLSEDIPPQDLERIANLINNSIGKGSLLEIRKDIMQRLIAERDSFFYILEKAKAIIDIMLDIVKNNKVYLDGRLYMTEKPEFKNIDKLKDLLRKLEDKDFLFNMLKRSLDLDGIKVYVGAEIADGFTDCGLITCNYSIGDTSCGTLGVLGPMRMDYPRLISMVSYVAESLSRHLSGTE